MGTVVGVAGNEDLRPVIEAARAALEAETGRADRLDSKARGQVTLAGSWFAIVQAVAAVALKADTPKGWVVAIGITAALGGLALFITMVNSARVWRLREQPAITHETLEDMTLAARQGPGTFDENLILLYRNLLGHAQERNNTRAEGLDAATFWWWATLVLAFAEMAVALLSRIFHG